MKNLVKIALMTGMVTGTLIGLAVTYYWGSTVGLIAGGFMFFMVSASIVSPDTEPSSYQSDDNLQAWITQMKMRRMSDQHDYNFMRQFTKGDNNDR